MYENGNVVYDPIRDLNEVEYNFLDLPTKVTTTKGIIEFTYDALGNQLKVNKNKDGTTLTILYADGIEYENNILKSYAFEEGRVVYNENIPGGSGSTYIEWAITDHLGNVRLRYVDKNKDGEINVDLSSSILNEITGSYHYYPFGQLMTME